MPECRISEYIDIQTQLGQPFLSESFPNLLKSKVNDLELYFESIHDRKVFTCYYKGSIVGSITYVNSNGADDNGNGIIEITHFSTINFNTHEDGYDPKHYLFDLLDPNYVGKIKIKGIGIFLLCNFLKNVHYIIGDNSIIKVTTNQRSVEFYNDVFELAQLEGIIGGYEVDDNMGFVIYYE